MNKLVEMFKETLFASAMGFAFLVGFGGSTGLCIYMVGLLLGAWPP